jgi:hypothetical protein
MQLANIKPLNPPNEKLNIKQIIIQKQKLKYKHDDHIVAHQFNSLIAVGIAIIEVAEVK